MYIFENYHPFDLWIVVMGALLVGVVFIALLLFKKNNSSYPVSGEYTDGTLHCQHDPILGSKLCAMLSASTKMGFLRWDVLKRTDDEIVLTAMGLDALWIFEASKHLSEVCLRSKHPTQMRLPMYINRNNPELAQLIRSMMIQLFGKEEQND